MCRHWLLPPAACWFAGVRSLKQIVTGLCWATRWVSRSEESLLYRFPQVPICGILSLNPSGTEETQGICLASHLPVTTTTRKPSHRDGEMSSEYQGPWSCSRRLSWEPQALPSALKGPVWFLLSSRIPFQAVPEYMTQPWPERWEVWASVPALSLETPGRGWQGKTGGEAHTCVGTTR